MKTKVQTIRRGDAAKLLDRLQQEIARWKDPQFLPEDKAQLAINTCNLLATLVERAGLVPLELCSGEGHFNPHIDSCSICAPRWGFVGPKVKVT